SRLAPPGTGCASSCLRTPKAKADARVPPPEKARPIATPLLARLGIGGAGGGVPCSGTLIGALAIVVQHDRNARSTAANTCRDFNRIAPPARRCTARVVSTSRSRKQLALRKRAFRSSAADLSHRDRIARGP